ncbi:site-specific integrase [Pedobacter sp. JCM 36344]|uniref:site-specific integrase n=1 Tax=Pedobacter sp. JCM 36344 TaxID=3374280 RepID=UPI00397B799A
MNVKFNLLFFLKKRANYQSGSVPVYPRVTVNGKRSEIGISREIEPINWDHRKERARGTKEEAREINAHIENVSTKIRSIQSKLEKEEISYTSEELKDEFLGRGSSSKMLLEVLEEHNTEMENEVGSENGFSANTVRTWKSTHAHLKQYINEKYGKPDYEIRRIDVNFITGYRAFLRTTRKCIPISADKYLKYLKKIILLALSRKWIIENPFLFVKLTAKPSPREFLRAHELDLIRNKEIKIDRMAQVRDIFVFCCYTGLAYIDVRKLNREEIGIGDDGKQWIFAKRHKTDTPARIPLLNEALDILERYSDHPMCRLKSTLLPVYTNQRMNSYLKEIADICGIQKTFTFHMARHTFATTVTLTNGVPMETVSKMLGHTSIVTTQHYAKILDGKIAEDMQFLQEKLDRKAGRNVKVEDVPVPQTRILKMYKR